jgi:hypothetical protein
MSRHSKSPTFPPSPSTSWATDSSLSAHINGYEANKSTLVSDGKNLARNHLNSCQTIASAVLCELPYIPFREYMAIDEDFCPVSDVKSVAAVPRSMGGIAG